MCGWLATADSRVPLRLAWQPPNSNSKFNISDSKLNPPILNLEPACSRQALNLELGLLYL
jgi:hypothetical protein